MAGQNFPVEGKSYILCNVLVLLKIVFFSHNFGSTYARKPIKGFKDAEFSLVSKQNLGQEND